jgi:CheY-specific phosphatase CheX
MEPITGMSPLQESLRTILTTKMSELFSDYGVACQITELPEEPSPRLCGILGFTGDRLCGLVVLSATHEAIVCSNPVGDGATRSWVAELTNQLLGRFKNALLRSGVEIALSIPVVLTATQLTPLPQTQVGPVHLAVGPGFVTIWLEIEAAPGLEIGEPSDDAMVATEGEALLF